MSKLFTKVLFLTSMVLMGIGVAQMSERWWQPSMSHVQATFQMPSNMLAGQAYELPLTIRNQNGSEIKICGEYTC